VVRQRVEPQRDLAVGAGGQVEPHERVAAVRVDANLDDQEVGPVAGDVRQHDLVEQPQVRGVAGAARERDVEGVAEATAGADLRRRARLRVEPAAVAVQRGVEDRLVPEKLLRAVAVMAVEVDDRDPLDAELALEDVDGDRDVVEDAEAAGPGTAGVVEAAAGVEGVVRLAPTATRARKSTPG